jgi:predicted nucleotidyltransferase component of viral defense system
MDLSRPSNLTEAENFEIASAMHAAILDNLFRETNWVAEQAVFHGGTALALARKSPRFSEDLDFMMTKEAAQELDAVIQKVRERVSLRMASQYDGGRVTLKGPKGEEVTSWNFKWEHPNKRGKVMVKVEFLVTEAALLKGYQSFHMVPTSRGALGVSVLVPVPELISAWADKVKAIATRPAFKWRDAFDISWIARCLKQEDVIPADEYRAALAATASIYGKTLEDVAEGLERVLASGSMDNVEDFEEDMGRWFLEEEASRYVVSGTFKRMLSEAKREVEKSLDLINTPSLGVTP